MLSKVWKKFLLAICILAILFNITSKLVNMISLEKTIASVPEGIDVKELLNITEENTTVTDESTVSTYTTEPENVVDSTGEQVENDGETSNEGSVVDVTDITDFTTLLY